MRISDWSSDVCSSDLVSRSGGQAAAWTRRRSSTWSSLRRQDRRVTETADRGLDVLGADQSVERQAGCVRDHRLEAQLANRMGSSGAPVARRQALQQLLVERERLDDRLTAAKAPGRTRRLLGGVAATRPAAFAAKKEVLGPGPGAAAQLLGPAPEMSRSLEADLPALGRPTEVLRVAVAGQSPPGADGSERFAHRPEIGRAHV